MAKNNVILMVTEPVRSERELLALLERINHLFRKQVLLTLHAIRDAETDCLRRLNEFSPTERTLSLEEAAAYVGLTKRALSDGTRPGRIPIFSFVVVAGKKRFRLSSLDRDLAARETKRPEIKL